MFLQSFPSGPISTNAYILACSKTLQAVIIDPAPESSEVLTHYLTSHHLNPIAILLTHSHWDHIADVAVLKKRFNIPVYVHPLDAPNLESPGADQLPCWLTIEGVKPTHLFNENTLISVGDLQLSVIHTPGHSPGGVCFYCAQENTLISGDTLFKGSIGNVSFPTSSPKAMWRSLEKLAQLPPSTLVYPGHGPSTSIAKENWLLQAEEIFGN